jgi:hypothetical protein
MNNYKNGQLQQNENSHNTSISINFLPTSAQLDLPFPR